MKNELNSQLEEEAKIFNTIELLDNEIALKHITNLSNKYVKDKNKLWWWESLSTPHDIVKYGSEDGLKIIEEKISKKSDVLLIVTDDEPEPWPVFKGNLEEIMELIREVRFFEFILADSNSEWLIFDTHHNFLVITGLLCKKTTDL